jgi:hypothetical protein
MTQNIATAYSNKEPEPKFYYEAVYSINAKKFLQHIGFVDIATERCMFHAKSDGIAVQKAYEKLPELRTKYSGGATLVDLIYFNPIKGKKKSISFKRENN